MNELTVRELRRLQGVVASHLMCLGRPRRAINKVRADLEALYARLEIVIRLRLAAGVLG